MARLLGHSNSNDYTLWSICSLDVTNHCKPIMCGYLGLTDVAASIEWLDQHPQTIFKIHWVCTDHISFAKCVQIISKIPSDRSGRRIFHELQMYYLSKPRSYNIYGVAAQPDAVLEHKPSSQQLHCVWCRTRPFGRKRKMTPQANTSK